MSETPIDLVRAKAIRRWRWALAIIVVVSGIGGVVPTVFGHRHASSAQHHNAVAGVIAIAAVLLVAVGASILFFRRSAKRGGVFSPPLAAGLPRRQRRQVARAVRRGTPSQDPLLRDVETQTATRALAQTRASLAIFGVAVVGETAVGVFGHHGTAGTIFFLLSAAMFIGLGALQLVMVRGAQRYLAQPPALDASVSPHSTS